MLLICAATAEERVPGASLPQLTFFCKPVLTKRSYVDVVSALFLRHKCRPAHGPIRCPLTLTLTVFTRLLICHDHTTHGTFKIALLFPPLKEFSEDSNEPNREGCSRNVFRRLVLSLPQSMEAISWNLLSCTRQLPNLPPASNPVKT